MKFVKFTKHFTFKRLIISNAEVLCTTDVLQETVLWTNAWIVQPASHCNPQNSKNLHKFDQTKSASDFRVQFTK
jgi:hypothetical protein